jgi:diketogulonate reductase-like aldo/keto reductase
MNKWTKYQKIEVEKMGNQKLSNGVFIPSIGLGTWKSTGDDAYAAVLTALKNGYRHIDTAAIYGNEEQVGKALKDSGLKREEIFITSKVWNTDQGYEQTKIALKSTLEKLGTTYLDLYLIHWFKGYEKQLSTWKAMEEAYEEGLVRAVGISNHNVHHIMNLLEHANIKPMVNQIETHVELQNEFLVNYCTKNNILVEAYAPLMSWRVKEMLEKEVLKEIADKYNKSITQVVLRWHIQRGIVPLPKSTNEGRIKSNFNIFDFVLSDEDMNLISTLNTGKKMFTEFDNVPY